MISKHISAWLLPLIFSAPFLYLSPSIDLWLTEAFYTHQSQSFSSHPFFLFFYHYGTLPAILTASTAFALLPVSRWVNPLRKWRRACVFLVLVMLAGPFLLVNVVLKDNWGRPRPKQIEQFGGEAGYLPFWQPDFSLQGEERKSFPSGHASMGFYFLALIFIGAEKKKRTIVITGILLTAFFGLVLSLTRIAMGGHFFSDVLSSALLMWYVCLFLENQVLCMD